ncbi:hypothetical protein [Commensalibacter oyaizuii]|uniref:Uncharacterized protein n=1 Tax=Commensalibacter oyaizuii TaxID=3043873 RepID=A0ABT6PY39_9PROT|nr:hypothetical protein [Commensalibacter sp. TBRC 16381]MDI2089781.1 hypothetical protein [Commensalibacter sp. TBRC 16381]
MINPLFFCLVSLCLWVFSHQQSLANDHSHSKTTTPSHHKPAQKHNHSEVKKSPSSSTSTLPSPQFEIYEGHGENKKNYVLALYPDRNGSALIAYDSPTCQANSHGTTIINPKKPSEIEFTSKEDPHCKITLHKIKDHQLSIDKETLACNAWHGDFCSFSSITPLRRIYPK